MPLIERKVQNKSSWRDHFKINKKLLPLKFTLFFFSASAFSILPYLTIHMKDIGIKVEHIALMYAILPFTIFFGKNNSAMIVSFLPNFCLSVCGILATLVAWFSFGFFSVLPILPCKMWTKITWYFRNFIAKRDQKPKTKNGMNETKAFTRKLPFRYLRMVSYTQYRFIRNGL